MLPPGVEIALEIRYGEVVRMFVEDTESTAYVDMLNDRPAGQGLDVGDELVDAVGELCERRHVGYLRADVEMQPEEIDVMQQARHLDGRGQGGDGDAELILFETGGYFRVRVCVDIRVHAQADPSGEVELVGDVVDDGQFLGGLHIEAEDMLLEGIAYLVVGLGNTGKDYLICIKPCLDGGFDLTTADTIGSDTTLGDRAQDSVGSAGFDGIVHMPLRVGHFVGKHTQRLTEDIHVVVVERRGDGVELGNGKMTGNHKRSVVRSQYSAEEGFT